ncbi:hypothetical protein ACFQNF_05680 [Iodobacter arcticus]|uniref:tRNA_anti-like n=1 Tax=Iodobacter arcticus TaxID=590593 RepID=A0ABW2QV06_9NEIS
MKKFLKWTGAVIVALITIGLIFGDNKPNTAEAKIKEEQAHASNTPNPQPVAAPALAVTAKTLGKAYEDNEAAADQQYKDKVLEVSGSIKSITKGPFDEVVVELKSGNDFLGVQAKLNKTDEAKAGQLKKGQAIKLHCTGAGEVTSIPMLDECTIL